MKNKTTINPQLVQRGQEMYERFKADSSIFTKRMMWCYFYRHVNGDLFLCVSDTLEECRKLKDEWITEQNS